MHTNSSLMYLQILPFTLAKDEEIIAGQPFLLTPPTSVEPPKEKPPPPPVDVSDDEAPPPPEPLKRLNSTRRIKKELRTRRSDFLGIEGVSVENFSLPSHNHLICVIRFLICVVRFLSLSLRKHVIFYVIESRLE